MNISIYRQLTENRTRLAKLLFSIKAVLGILSIGGAALYGAAWTSGNAWTAFFSVFVPFALLWALFCYAAYGGLTSEKTVLKFVFWLYVVGNVFIFPVGTAFAGVAIWLWRDSRKQNIVPVST